MSRKANLRENKIIDSSEFFKRVRHLNLRMKNLLLIDDDPGVLRALTLLLKAFGYTVEAFTSPLDAIAYLRAPNRIEIVLSDLRMPGLSGEDVLKQVRAEFVALPVIIMSGHATAEDMARLKSLGSNAFIPKPFTPAQLMAAMADIESTMAA
jgi:two-component system response regulator GlrR